MIHSLITLAVIACAASALANAGPWSSARGEPVEGLPRSMVEYMLDRVHIGSFEGKADVFVSKFGTRSATHLALALLTRNEQGDCEQAAAILNEVLDWQCTDTTRSAAYGNWPRYDKNEFVINAGIDQNWREFVGCGLVVARAYFDDRLPQQLVRRLDEALLHAATGSMRRDVAASYTNIAVMSAFITEYVGGALGQPHIHEWGKNKASQVLELHARYETFTEYNSPTYDATTLRAFALWRALGQSQWMRGQGERLERAMWLDIATHYHVGLLNMVGPYFRTYEMDMNRSYTATAIWIALLLDNTAQSPMPPEGSKKFFEYFDAVFPVLLGVPAGDDVVARLGTVPGRAAIRHKVPNIKADRFLRAGDSGLDHYVVTATLEPQWMMGGVEGYRGTFNQFVAGALHWRDLAGEINWIALPGAVNANARVDGSTMTISRGQCEKRLALLVFSPDWQPPAELAADMLELPGITLDLEYADVMHIRPLPDDEREKYTCDTSVGIVEWSLNVRDDAPADAPLLKISVKSPATGSD